MYPPLILQLTTFTSKAMSSLRQNRYRQNPLDKAMTVHNVKSQLETYRKSINVGEYVDPTFRPRDIDGGGSALI
jgi:hypothetical protein